MHVFLKHDHFLGKRAMKTQYGLALVTSPARKLPLVIKGGIGCVCMNFQIISNELDSEETSVYFKPELV